MSRFTSDERAALVAGMTAASLVPLNSTLIAVGLPEIGRDLHVGRGTTAVLVTTYLIGMALLQPFSGRLGDRFGTRRVIAVGLVGFAACSAFAAASPTFGALLGARIAQAAFGAGFIPNVQALIRGVVADARRGRAFGILGVGIGAGAAVGPVLGGAVTQVASWRGIFGVSIPIAVTALWLLTRLHADVGAPPPAVTDAHAVTRTLTAPVLAACVVQAAGNFSQYSVLLVVPLALDATGWSSAAAGLILSGMTVGLLVMSPIGGSLGDRVGRRIPVVTGNTLGFLGAALLAAFALRFSAVLVVGIIVVGLGMGLASASLQAAALESVPPNRVGVAAGIMSTSRYVGSIGSTVAIAAFVGEGTRGIQTVLALGMAAGLIAVGASTQVGPGTNATRTRREREADADVGGATPA